MKFTLVAAAAAMLGAVSAKGPSPSRSFAVLRFNNKQLTKGRVDPIVNPGKTAGHVHVVAGGSNFSPTSTGEDLKNSKCSTAKIKGDNSNYWWPQLFFHDPGTGKYESVDVDYVNAYYL